MIAPLRPRLAILVVVCGLAVALIGCNRTGKVRGEGRLEPAGRVLLTHVGHQAGTVDGSRTLEDGDVIELVEGAAKVTLPAGEVLELRPRSVMFFSRGPELRTGDLLVSSSGSSGSSGTIRAAGSDVVVTGAARITVAPGLRVVTYQGAASLRSGGRVLVVPALRSAEVQLIGLLPGRPSPLVLDRADPWVGRFLGEAADTEAALESRSRGFTGQVNQVDAASAAFYRALLPGLSSQSDFQPDAVDRLVRAQPEAAGAGEALVGSAIAIEGRRGTFTERLAGAAAFRGEGATWAVVAVDQQVPSLKALLRLVDGAVNAAPLELAAPPPIVLPGLPSARPPAVATTTTRPSGTRSSATTSTTRPPARTQPPSTSPPPLHPLDPLVDATVDPVVGLLTDLLGHR